MTCILEEDILKFFKSVPSSSALLTFFTGLQTVMRCLFSDGEVRGLFDLVVGHFL